VAQRGRATVLAFRAADRRRAQVGLRLPLDHRAPARGRRRRSLSRRGYLDSKARAHEGESGLRSGEELSSLVQRWRQLPRDWIDFVETGEISGEYEAMFTNMETESARNWTLAQDRMTEWVPKILTFVLLIVVGCMIGRACYNVVVAPIQQAEKVIDSQ
jgi:type II secretory pathway component PulF